MNVTRAQVEDTYKQNVSFFATMSPDEERERLRLDTENALMNSGNEFKYRAKVKDANPSVIRVIRG